ncbi:MAG: DUF3889 domain-containing protein [Bacillota bacterium]
MLRHIFMKAVFVLLSLAHPEVIRAEGTVQYAEPAYAKWGKLAMEETSKAYRNASIVDYKYEGRTVISEGEAEERFVLWIVKDTREFGVRVSIRVKTDTDELINVRMQELIPNN